MLIRSRQLFLSKSLKIGLHILSIAAFIGWEISYVNLSGNPTPLWVFAIYYFFDIGYFYLISFVYLPYLVKKFRYDITLFVFSIFIAGFYALFILLVGSYLTYLYIGKLSFNYTGSTIAASLNRCLVFMVFAFGYWNARHRLMKIKAMKEKELELSQSREREALMQNALLRAQINPHFLFNTLNGIYLKFLKKAPEDAGIVLLLAEMMDYSLVNTKENATTTIGHEVQQLDRLVKLYQFVNNDTLQILYDVDVPDQAKELNIIPLLFFNLTENIFKHGKVDDPNRPAEVKLRWHNNQIEFTSSNLKSYSAQGLSRKIGLSNTRNRLQLHYPENYELSISETEDRFEVRLIICL